MSTIKKAFQPIMSVLAAALTNEQVTQEVHDEVLALTVAKTGNGGGKASTFHRDEDGTVVGVLCYYHKLWMNPADVEFGAKASSPTGLNNMCKDGVSKWTAQQRKAKQAESTLLAQLSSGELAIEDLEAAQAEIEAERVAIIPREDGYGYATLEALLEA